MCVNKLKSCVEAWHQIQAPDYVIEWIQNGVSIPFSSDVESFELENHSFNFKQSSFVNSEIDRLLHCGFIDICGDKPVCVSPLGVVPKKRGKLRLITDLRRLNSHCDVPKYRNEDIRDTVKLLQPSDYFVSTDIRDGFFHIPVHKDFRKYLGFKWNGIYYSWNVLVFGLCCSPYYFNKIVRPVITYLRSLGLRVTVFVDDFLLAAHISCITDHKDLLLHTLQDLGFSVNFEKSVLVPRQSIGFIGYTISSVGSKLLVKAQSQRVSSVKHTLRHILKHQSVSARTLAKALGKCVSVAWVVSPGKLFLRKSYRLLSSRLSWEDKLILTAEVTEELQWWLSSIDYWNAREVCSEIIQAQVFTDASALGWGAVYNGRVASGDWNKRVSYLTSNEREMLAILMALKAFASLLQGLTVQFFTDNISARAYVNHMGGPSPTLSALAFAIWSEATELGITLRCEHIAGVQNGQADYWSRTPDKHNWMLHPRVFQYLDQLYGKHTIDRFANCQNTQVARFNSRYWDPLSEGVDALAQDNWGCENNYVNPPFCLIPRVLDVVEKQQAHATLIAPVWKAQTWFRRLLKMTVSPPLQLPNSHNIFRAMSVALPEPRRNRKWKICAWRIYGGKIS